MALEVRMEVVEVFTHIHPDGTVRHFNTTFMRDHALTHSDDAELLVLPMDPEFLSFAVRERGVDPMKVVLMSDPWLHEPVLGVKLSIHSEETVFVDGHHRLIKLFLEGEREYRMLRLKPSVWEQFLITLDQIDAAMAQQLVDDVKTSRRLE